MPASDLKRALGLAGGLGLFLVIALVPLGIEPAAARGLALAALCAAWWVTEAIPVAATALVPAVALPLMGVMPLEKTLSSYAHPLIFLFLGGFLIAQAMRTCGLDRRIASLALAVAGTRPAVVLAAFMGATAAISAFISNTATAAMMLPIGIAVLDRAGLAPGSRFAKALLLGLAWSASIGGVATFVGSPPNAVLAGFADRLLGREMGFTAWLAVGLPYTAVMLPVAWAVLVLCYRPEVRRIEAAPAGVVEGGAAARWITTAVFAAVVVLWTTRGFWKHLPWGFAKAAAGEMSDSVVAMAGGLSLFVIPARTSPWRGVLTWKEARELPWGVLILFGGGLALGSGLFESGAAEWLAGRLESVGSLPAPFLVGLVTLMGMLITEVTSNTATANMLVPLVFALAARIGVDPYLLGIPAVLAASSAFMLPVATPPNALVYGTGRLTMADMAATGAILNGVGLVVIVLLTMLVTGPLLGM